MEILQYLSVMTPPASSGNLVLEVDTYDLLQNVSIVYSVTGMSGTETCEQLANEIAVQLTTYFTQNNYLFQNVPPLPADAPTITIPPFLAFPDQAMSPMWNVTHSDHVFCLMSQCQFNLKVNTNTTGAAIVTDESPVLITYQDAITSAAAKKIVFEDAYGNPMTQSAVIEVLRQASSELINWLGINIVPTTYLDYEITRGEKSFFFRKRPTIDFFAPVVRRPIIFAIQQITANATVKQNFALDRAKGELYYRFSQDFVSNVEPFDDGNEVMVAYVSGYKRIPKIIKDHVIKFTELLGVDRYDKQTGEGFSVDFKKHSETLQHYATALKGFFC